MKILLAALTVMVSFSAIASTNNDDPLFAPTVSMYCKQDGKDCAQRVYDALLNAGCEPFEQISCDAGAYNLERCHFKTRNCSSPRLNVVFGHLECNSIYTQEIAVSRLDKTLSSRADKNMFGGIKSGFICSK